MSTYRWISLGSRSVDCSSISFDQFREMMVADIKSAIIKYNDAYITWLGQARENEYQRMLANTTKRAEEFALRKWKTEKRRKEYIDSAIDEFKSNYKTSLIYRSLSFFDFDVDPGKMGCTSIINVKNIDNEDYMHYNVYDCLMNGKYFKKGIGWELGYIAREGSYEISFRPEIKLLVSDETAKEMEADKKRLEDDVNSFYSNTTYFGD